MTNQRRDMLLLAEGCYSDYQTSPYVVLKPFTLRDVLDEFLASVRNEKEASGRQYLPDGEPSDFIAFLSSQGYIADADIVEVHCGQYGRTTLSSNVLDMRFEPAQEPA